MVTYAFIALAVAPSIQEVAIAHVRQANCACVLGQSQVTSSGNPWKNSFRS